MALTGLWADGGGGIVVKGLRGTDLRGLERVKLNAVTGRALEE